MNRNVESHFAELPRANIERSTFDLSHEHMTSFNVGQLIPIYWKEVLPGDTFKMTTSAVVRLQTLLTPAMASIWLDTYWFYIPTRLCWTHWKEFMGEAADSKWLPTATYSMPKISSPDNGWSVGTIADYLGIPPGVEFNSTNGLQPMALPFRAYALVANEWFRDQNLTDPLNIPLGDSDQTGSNGTSYINDVANGGMPFIACKQHDMFSSCLPAPQAGQAVSFGTNPIVSGSVPVVPGSAHAVGDSFRTLFHTATTIPSSGVRRLLIHGPTYETEDSGYGRYTETNETSVQTGGDYAISNYWADPSVTGSTFAVSGVSFTINELRLAFQLQKFYEKRARGGRRYREQILEMFNVVSPDARMMIPEYLGGHRFPIQIHQIANTAESSSAKLGDLGAMSNTSDIHEDFVKSFTEHGFVMGFAVARYQHAYPQGLAKEWMRESALDYFWPVFSSIGEQPVFKYQIDATVRANEDRKEVFGYNEAWCEYRFSNDFCSSEMRPGVTNSLASWHVADYYTAMPSLSDSWIREDKTNVDRILAVTSLTSNQIFADFYFQNFATRPMPVYSVPGLIDHH